MLKRIYVNGTGPSEIYDLEVAPRLNLITGDNGLGKTFLLDLLWYACTATWARVPALPNSGDEKPSIIGFFSESDSLNPISLRSTYDRDSDAWMRDQPPKLFNNVLAIYANVKSEYSVWDSMRTPFMDGDGLNAPWWEPRGEFPDAYRFSETEIWEGKSYKHDSVCQGLKRDLLEWPFSNRPSSIKANNLLQKILYDLFPAGQEPIFGPPVRMSVRRSLETPTIFTTNGYVPITVLSSAMKRVLELAYLIVWSWLEHQEATSTRKVAPAKSVVLLIDEIENHLHPAWQREILPSILNMLKNLTSVIETQLFITTHSPLVLASLEPIFKDTDQLLLLEKQGNVMKIESLDWVSHGEASNWLTSDIFGLQQARSSVAENLILQAREFLLQNINKIEFDRIEFELLDTKLKSALGPTDRFWEEWSVPGIKL